MAENENEDRQTAQTGAEAERRVVVRVPTTNPVGPTEPATGTDGPNGTKEGGATSAGGNEPTGKLEYGKEYWLTDANGKRVRKITLTKKGEKLFKTGMGFGPNKKATADARSGATSRLKGLQIRDAEGNIVAKDAGPAMQAYIDGDKGNRGIMEGDNQYFHVVNPDKKNNTKTKPKKGTKEAEDVQKAEDSTAQAKEEEKPSWWERNKNWIYWTLGILGVGALAAIGILGFRKGGWWNKKKPDNIIPGPGPKPDDPGKTPGDNYEKPSNLSTNTNAGTGTEFKSDLQGTLGDNGTQLPSTDTYEPSTGLGNSLGAGTGKEF